MPNDITRETILSRYHQEINKLEEVSANRSIFLYFQTYSAIAMAILLALTFKNTALTIIVLIFIAGRQHSLYILNHDASHYSLFKSRKINKYVAFIFSNLVMFHHPEAWSYVMWRRVHLKHHSYLFTAKDPNYVGRLNSGDTQHAYSILKLMKSCALAIPLTMLYFIKGKSDYVKPLSREIIPSHTHHLAALFIPFYQDKEMEAERLLKLSCYLSAFVLINYFSLWQPFLLFWIAPMYLFYPAILKFHDLTEHYWDTHSSDPMVNARSVNRWLITKVIVSFLPRHYHREHHLFPKASVTSLPKIHQLLTAQNLE